MDYPTLPTTAKATSYWLQLERLIKGYSYRHQDPPAQHKLTIPVSLVEFLMELGSTSSSTKVKGICDMSTIAFYRVHKEPLKERTTLHQAVLHM
jgi:hypothetical protein